MTDPQPLLSFFAKIWSSVHDRNAAKQVKPGARRANISGSLVSHPRTFSSAAYGAHGSPCVCNHRW
jgi:hypothetical protein